MKSFTQILLGSLLLLNGGSLLIAQDNNQVTGYRLQALSREQGTGNREQGRNSSEKALPLEDQIWQQGKTTTNCELQTANCDNSAESLNCHLMMNPAIESAEEAIERFLTLEDFRNAIDQHPTATRFVIREEEGGNTFIQPQESDAAAPGRNRSKNMEITQALKAALEREHSPEAVKKLLPPNNSLSFNCPPLNAERLSTILHRSESLSFSDVSTHKKNKGLELESQKLEEAASQDQLIIASEGHPSEIGISGERENERTILTEGQKNLTKSTVILSPSYVYNRNMAFRIFVLNYLIRPIIKNQQVIEYRKKVNQAYSQTEDQSRSCIASSWIYLAVNWINVAEEAERALKIRLEKKPCIIHQLSSPIYNNTHSQITDLVCTNSVCNTIDQVAKYRAQSVVADCSGALEGARCFAKAAEALADTRHWNVPERNAIIVKANAERERALRRYDDRDPKSRIITQAKEFEEEERYVEKVSVFWKETAGLMHRSTEYQEEAVKATVAKNKVAARQWTQAAEGVEIVVHDLIDFMQSDDFGRKNTIHTRKYVDLGRHNTICGYDYDFKRLDYIDIMPNKDGNMIDLAQRIAENAVNYWEKMASERKPQVSERWEKAAKAAAKAVQCWAQTTKVTPTPKTEHSDSTNSCDENDNPWNEAAGSWNNAAEYWVEAAEGKNQSIHRWAQAAEAAEKAASYWTEDASSLESKNNVVAESMNSQKSNHCKKTHCWDHVSSCWANINNNPKNIKDLEAAILYWTNAATASTKEESNNWIRVAEATEESVNHKSDAASYKEAACRDDASKRYRSEQRASMRSSLAKVDHCNTIALEAKNAAEAKRQAYNAQTISAETNVSSSSSSSQASAETANASFSSESKNQSSNLSLAANNIAVLSISGPSSASATLITDAKATEQEQKSSAKGKKNKKK